MIPVSLPSCLDELWETLTRHPGAALYAGGTDLLVKRRKGLVTPPSLVCLERIPELRGIQDHGDRVYIGACTTHGSLLSSPLVLDRFPVLAQALRCLGSPPIRHMGTIGGNVVSASPAGDTLPPLYVLGAHLELRSRDSSRRVPVQDFIRGPGATDLQQGEILAGIWLQNPGPGWVHHFEKVGQRKALAIALASLAAMLHVSRQGLIQEARLAWGSVAPTVATSKAVEAALAGRPLEESALAGVFPLVQEALSPIDDVRASAAYRRAVSAHLVLRLCRYADGSSASSSPSLREGP
ncbi:MAG: xanthine dehydrogenase family protein subunit M [Thermodesulfobacteriota bacterium]